MRRTEMGWINASASVIWRMFHPGASDDSGWVNKAPDDDYWYEPRSPGMGMGFRVTPDIALKASALFSCVKVLSETIGSLPLRLYRELADEGREPVSSNVDEIIRHRPNQNSTAVEFWETMVLYAALNGTAYAEKVHDRRGRLTEIVPITAPVQVQQLKDRSLDLRFWDPLLMQHRTLFGDEVLRIPGLSADGFQGMRVVDIAADAIGLGLQQEVYASKVFQNGLNMGGYLVHPGKLSPDAQKNFIHELMLRHSGAQRAHRPLLLQEGMKWEKAGQTAEEAQLLEARKWQVGEVARFFRIPLHMLGIYDGATRSNVEQQSLDLVKYTLRPWVRRVEQAIKRDLIQPRDHFAKYSMEGLLRGDAESRSKFYHGAILDGYMTRNEVRALENLNKLPGLDMPLVPLNEAMIDEQGEVVQISPGGDDRQQPSIPDEPAEEPEPAQLEPPPRAITDQRLSRFVSAAAERVVRKEILALRRREPLDDAWLTEFYGKHRKFVEECLDLTPEAAAVYAQFQENEVRQAMASDALDALLDRWEANRATELSDCILENAA